jgi:RNA polymerase sigma-70 factor (ECF subfamily)
MGPTDLPDAPLDVASLTELSARLVAGQRSALEELYARTSALIFTAALKALSDPVRAEEVTEQVFVSAWERRAEHHPDERPATAWLLAIARVLVGDALAEQSGSLADGDRPAHLGPNESETRQQIAQRVIDVVVVADAIERLEQPNREVIEQSFFEGRTHTEIAAALGLPVASVDSGIKTALGQLSAYLRFSDGAS